MGFNMKIERGHAVLLGNLIDYVKDNIPKEYMPEEIKQIKYQLDEMLERGCFKHGNYCTIFTDVVEGDNSYKSSAIICKDCDPSRHKHYMNRVKEGLATMEEYL